MQFTLWLVRLSIILIVTGPLCMLVHGALPRLSHNEAMSMIQGHWDLTSSGTIEEHQRTFPCCDPNPCPPLPSCGGGYSTLDNIVSPLIEYLVYVEEVLRPFVSHSQFRITGGTEVHQHTCYARESNKVRFDINKCSTMKGHCCGTKVDVDTQVGEFIAKNMVGPSVKGIRGAIGKSNFSGFSRETNVDFTSVGDFIKYTDKKTREIVTFPGFRLFWRGQYAIYWSHEAKYKHYDLEITDCSVEAFMLHEFRKYHSGGSVRTVLVDNGYVEGLCPNDGSCAAGSYVLFQTSSGFKGSKCNDGKMPVCAGYPSLVVFRCFTLKNLGSDKIAWQQISERASTLHLTLFGMVNHASRVSSSDAVALASRGERVPRGGNDNVPTALSVKLADFLLGATSAFRHILARFSPDLNAVEVVAVDGSTYMVMRSASQAAAKCRQVREAVKQLLPEGSELARVLHAQHYCLGHKSFRSYIKISIKHAYPASTSSESQPQHALSAANPLSSRLQQALATASYDEFNADVCDYFRSITDDECRVAAKTAMLCDSLHMAITNSSLPTTMTGSASPPKQVALEFVNRVFCALKSIIEARLAASSQKTMCNAHLNALDELANNLKTVLQDIISQQLAKGRQAVATANVFIREVADIVYRVQSGASVSGAELNRAALTVGGFAAGFSGQVSSRIQKFIGDVASGKAVESAMNALQQSFDQRILAVESKASRLANVSALVEREINRAQQLAEQFINKTASEALTAIGDVQRLMDTVYAEVEACLLEDDAADRTTEPVSFLKAKITTLLQSINQSKALQAVLDDQAHALESKISVVASNANDAVAIVSDELGSMVSAFDERINNRLAEVQSFLGRLNDSLLIETAARNALDNLLEPLRPTLANLDAKAANETDAIRRDALDTATNALVEMTLAFDAKIQHLENKLNDTITHLYDIELEVSSGGDPTGALEETKLLLMNETSVLEGLLNQTRNEAELALVPLRFAQDAAAEYLENKTFEIYALLNETKAALLASTIPFREAYREATSKVADISALIANTNELITSLSEEKTRNRLALEERIASIQGEANALITTLSEQLKGVVASAAAELSSQLSSNSTIRALESSIAIRLKYVEGAICDVLISQFSAGFQVLYIAVVELRDRIQQTHDTLLNEIRAARAQAETFIKETEALNQDAQRVIREASSIARAKMAELKNAVAAVQDKLNSISTKFASALVDGFSKGSQVRQQVDVFVTWADGEALGILSHAVEETLSSFSAEGSHLISVFVDLKRASVQLVKGLILPVVLPKRFSCDELDLNELLREYGRLIDPSITNVPCYSSISAIPTFRASMCTRVRMIYDALFAEYPGIAALLNLKSLDISSILQLVASIALADSNPDNFKTIFTQLGNTVYEVSRSVPESCTNVFSIANTAAIDAHMACKAMTQSNARGRETIGMLLSAMFLSRVLPTPFTAGMAYGAFNGVPLPNVIEYIAYAFGFDLRGSGEARKAMATQRRHYLQQSLVASAEPAWLNYSYCIHVNNKNQTRTERRCLWLEMWTTSRSFPIEWNAKFHHVATDDDHDRQEYFPDDDDDEGNSQWDGSTILSEIADIDRKEAHNESLAGFIIKESADGTFFGAVCSEVDDASEYCRDAKTVAMLFGSDHFFEDPDIDSLHHNGGQTYTRHWRRVNMSASEDMPGEFSQRIEFDHHTHVKEVSMNITLDLRDAEHRLKHHEIDTWVYITASLVKEESMRAHAELQKKTSNHRSMHRLANAREFNFRSESGCDAYPAMLQQRDEERGSRLPSPFLLHRCLSFGPKDFSATLMDFLASEDCDDDCLSRALTVLATIGKESEYQHFCDAYRALEDHRPGVLETGGVDAIFATLTDTFTDAACAVEISREIHSKHHHGNNKTHAHRLFHVMSESPEDLAKTLTFGRIDINKLGFQASIGSTMAGGFIDFKLGYLVEYSVDDVPQAFFLFLVARAEVYLFGRKFPIINFRYFGNGAKALAAAAGLTGNIRGMGNGPNVGICLLSFAFALPAKPFQPFPPIVFPVGPIMVSFQITCYVYARAVLDVLCASVKIAEFSIGYGGAVTLVGRGYIGSPCILTIYLQLEVDIFSLSDSFASGIRLRLAPIGVQIYAGRERIMQFCKFRLSAGVEIGIKLWRWKFCLRLAFPIPLPFGRTPPGKHPQVGDGTNDPPPFFKTGLDLNRTAFEDHELVFDYYVNRFPLACTMFIGEIDIDAIHCTRQSATFVLPADTLFAGTYDYQLDIGGELRDAGHLLLTGALRSLFPQTILAFYQPVTVVAPGMPTRDQCYCVFSSDTYQFQIPANHQGTAFYDCYILLPSTTYTLSFYCVLPKETVTAQLEQMDDSTLPTLLTLRVGPRPTVASLAPQYVVATVPTHVILRVNPDVDHDLQIKCVLSPLGDPSLVVGEFDAVFLDDATIQCLDVVVPTDTPYRQTCSLRVKIGSQFGLLFVYPIKESTFITYAAVDAFSWFLAPDDRTLLSSVTVRGATDPVLASDVLDEFCSCVVMYGSGSGELLAAVVEGVASSVLNDFESYVACDIRFGTYVTGAFGVKVNCNGIPSTTIPFTLHRVSLSPEFRNRPVHGNAIVGFAITPWLPAITIAAFQDQQFVGLLTFVAWNATGSYFAMPPIASTSNISLVVNFRSQPTIAVLTVLQTSCSTPCRGGWCDHLNGVCMCAYEGSSVACDSLTCPNYCNGKGFCRQGRCACQRGYFGDGCQHDMPPVAFWPLAFGTFASSYLNVRLRLPPNPPTSPPSNNGTSINETLPGAAASVPLADDSPLARFLPQLECYFFDMHDNIIASTFLLSTSCTTPAPLPQFITRMTVCLGYERYCVSDSTSLFQLLAWPFPVRTPFDTQGTIRIHLFETHALVSGFAAGTNRTLLVGDRPMNCTVSVIDLEDALVLNDPLPSQSFPAYRALSDNNRSMLLACRAPVGYINESALISVWVGETKLAIGAVSFELPECPAGCSGHGVCSQNGKCICEDPYIGPRCGERGCPRQCSGHGQCLLKGVVANVPLLACNCSHGFTGPSCQQLSMCTPNCPNLEVGDGTCHASCNVAECGFDGGDCRHCDCPASQLAFPTCSIACAFRGCNATIDYDPRCIPLLANVSCPSHFAAWLVAFCASVADDGICHQKCLPCGTEATDCPVKHDASPAAAAQCHPLCTSSMLLNDACDPECATELCNYDNGKCTRFVQGKAVALCASGCTEAFLNDSVCQPACNTSACGFDNGHCLCRSKCYPWMLGDGRCDLECSGAACLDDHGDCASCAPGCRLTMVGDGRCDVACKMSAACNFDGQDCGDPCRFSVCQSWEACAVDASGNPYCRCREGETVCGLAIPDGLSCAPRCQPPLTCQVGVCSCPAGSITVGGAGFPICVPVGKVQAELALCRKDLFWLNETTGETVCACRPGSVESAADNITGIAAGGDNGSAVAATICVRANPCTASADTALCDPELESCFPTAEGHTCVPRYLPENSTSQRVCDCGPMQTCIVWNGKLTCRCIPGFVAFNGTCFRDVCQNVHCPSGSSCEASAGTGTCRCDKRFHELVRHADTGEMVCQPIDLCAQDRTRCGDPRSTVCTSIFDPVTFSPSFHCACMFGFVPSEAGGGAGAAFMGGGGSQGSAIHCERPIVCATCHRGEICVNGSACACPSGFVRVSPSLPNNTGTACAVRTACFPPCAYGEECSLGTLTCQCARGFQLNSVTGSCDDIDECARASAICPEYTMCVNTPGSYTCGCPAGTIGSNATGCCKCPLISLCTVPDRVISISKSMPLLTCSICGNDDMEWDSVKRSCVPRVGCDKNCAPGATCVCSSDMAACACQCPQGYTGDGAFACYPLDPCANLQCNAGAVCDLNLAGSGEPFCRSVGSIDCDCIADPGITCTSNETIGCLSDGYYINMPPAALNASTCEWTASWVCLPPVTPAPTTSAPASTHDCDPPCDGAAEECANSVCRCIPGYMRRLQEGPPKRLVCTPRPNCSQTSCGPTQACVDTVEGYRCDRNSCLFPVRIDCGQGTCRHTAEGIPECDCGQLPRSPVTGTCVHARFCDVVRCDAVYGVCTDDPAVFGRGACSCMHGFVLAETNATSDPDANACRDFDECTEVRHGFTPCDAGGVCRNKLGSWACDCKPGYFHPNPGDIACEDIDECHDDAICGYGGTCGNTPGSYVCTCLPGYSKPIGSDPIRGMCMDTNECDNVAACDTNTSTCVNSVGSYHCSCLTGFTPHPDSAGKICVDIHECDSDDTCGPDGFCEELPGSYRCVCFASYFHPVARNDSVPRPPCTLEWCSSVLECNGIGNCTVDKFGDHRCECPEYFTGAHCEFCNPLFCNGQGTCDASASCSCNIGWSGEKCRTCDSLVLCNNLGVCNATTGRCDCHPGNWGEACTERCPESALYGTCGGATRVCDGHTGACICPSGWDSTAFGSCTDHVDCIDDALICGTGGRCVDAPRGSYTCICSSPWFFLNATTNRCQDTDECLTHNGGCEQLCTNTIGDRTCGCRKGYLLQSDNVSCTSVCDLGAHYCDLYSTVCDKDTDSFCACRGGFANLTFNTSVGQWQCTDINECDRNASICSDPWATCYNLEPFYTCRCPQGLTYNATTKSCHDVNECIDPAHHVCSLYQHTACENIVVDTPSATEDQFYNCKCNYGFTRPPLTTRGDCFADLTQCTSRCPNSTGECVPSNVTGYECRCLAGYRSASTRCHMDGNKFCSSIEDQCVDIDDCHDPLFPHACGTTGVCRNLIGSYACDCKSGCTANASSATRCSDIDECVANSNQCPRDTTCVNIPDCKGYECRCNFKDTTRAEYFACNKKLAYLVSTNQSLACLYCGIPIALIIVPSIGSNCDSRPAACKPAP